MMFQKAKTAWIYNLSTALRYIFDHKDNSEYSILCYRDFLHENKIMRYGYCFLGEFRKN